MKLYGFIMDTPITKILFIAGAITVVAFVIAFSTGFVTSLTGVANITPIETSIITVGDNQQLNMPTSQWWRFIVAYPSNHTHNK